MSSCANGYDVLKLMCMVCLLFREFVQFEQFGNFTCKREIIQSLGGEYAVA